MENSRAGGQTTEQELVNIARYVGRVGPRINLVARLVHQPKESVRYRYKRFFLDKKVAIQAVPNYSRLGLGRIIVLAELAPELESRATDIFATMSDVCYLRGFTRVSLGHQYFIQVAVPNELKADCVSLFRKFHEVGLFTEAKILEFEEMRNPPMMAEFYNFADQMWRFSWSEFEGDEQMSFPTSREVVQKYDKLDLLILKELELDANRRLVEIARNVGASHRAVRVHHLKHVEGRGLVKSYHLGWQGSRYDFVLRKAFSGKDRYLEIIVLLEGASRSESHELRTLTNRLPFLWSEAVGPNYFSELFIPPNFMTGFLEYVEPFAVRVGGKMRIFMMDQTRALRFTISYKLFDDRTRSWQLDRSEALSRIENLTGRRVER